MVLSRPEMFIGVAFNLDPFDTVAVPVWADLTSRAYGIGDASRGRSYELDQNQAGALDVVFHNADEALNPANTGSPYASTIYPYRRILARCMWPNGGTGNLLNLAYNATDGSFDSYTDGGPIPSWLVPVGTITPSGITTSFTQSGAECAFYAVSAAGQGVSWSVPCIPGRQYTSTAYVRNTTAANTLQISLSTGATGTSTTTVGAYVRLSITFTASQPTHTLRVLTVGATTADTVRIDSIQHEPGAAATAFTATGPLIKNIWTPGYVERWPAQWADAGFRGVSSVPCVGPFAILENTSMHSEYRAALAAKSPNYLWPLQESSTTTSTFAVASTFGGPSLVRVNGPFGAATTFSPATAMNIVGDPGGVGVKIDGAQTASPPNSVLSTGYQNLTPSLDFGPFTTPRSMSASIWASRTATAVNTYLMFASQANVTSPFFFIRLTTGPQVTFQADTAANFSVTDIWADGLPHLYTIVVTLTGADSTVTGYIDGVLVGTGTSTPLSTPFPTCVMVGGYMQPSGPTALPNVPNGTYGYLALWNRALSAAEVTDLGNAGRGYSGENSTTRTQRQLALAGFTAASASAGTSTLGPSTVTEGSSLLATAQRNADSEFGNFYESADGIAIAGRSERYLRTASTYTFGENVAGGEYPYEEDISFDFDPQLVINYADVTRSGGIKAHAENATSQRRYGRKPFTRTIDSNSDNEATDAATWVVNNRKDVLQRVSSVTFNPAATVVPFGDGTLWPMVLMLEIGMRVTVKRRPKAANAGAGITMSGDYFIEHVSHHDIDFEAGTWLTTLQLSPVPAAQPWILQNATYGVLDSTTVLGF